MIVPNIATLSYQSLGVLLASSFVLAGPLPETGNSLESRQGGRSSTWVDTCSSQTTAPSNFRSFDLGDCNFQLTLERDRNHIAMELQFEAVYADGSRQTFVPYRDFSNFAVSDIYYSVDLGNNWVNSSAQSRRFTSVHEVTTVCNNGAAPIGWYYLAKADGTSCGRPPNYVWTSPLVGVMKGTRPGNTNPTGRRINNAGDFEITWQPVANAAAYTILFEVPTGSDEVGNPYTRIIGKRVSGSSTSSVQQGIISRRWEGRTRRVAVNVMNSLGVWNLASGSRVVSTPW